MRAYCLFVVVCCCCRVLPCVRMAKTKPLLRPVEQARLEVHDRYIDVQVPLSGTESFGVRPRNECLLPDGDMDRDNDIMFYKDPIETIINVKAGEVVVFPPDTAHAPLIGEGGIHKAVFKVRVC